MSAVRMLRFGALLLLILLPVACGGDAPAIPHAVATQADSACARCHRPHHSGCVDCHEIKDSWLPVALVDGGNQADGGSSSTPRVPHQTPRLDDATCLDCHASGKWDAPAPAHSTRTGCVDCHGENR
jgi:hypothetical protein